MPKLHVVLVSTRPGRVGETVAKWFADYATQDARFEVELVDVAEFNLPIFDEPNHPMRQQYEHEHTKRWSEKVSEADAFAFVMPEYNHNPPPSFFNALNYLHREWSYKPAIFVAYGGVSGAQRAAEVAKMILTTLKIMPLPEGVIVPFVQKFVDDEGAFTANELIEKSATTALEELHKWAEALQPLRG